MTRGENLGAVSGLASWAIITGCQRLNHGLSSERVQGVRFLLQEHQVHSIRAHPP